MYLQGLTGLLLCYSRLHLIDATRFAIVSVVSGPVPQPFYAQGITNRALYATRHDYALRVFNKIDHERPTPWSKILALKSTMKTEHFDWLLWMDGDALITNFETHLDEFLPDTKGVDLVIAKDCTGLNTGIFMLRCSRTGLQLPEEIYSGSHVTNDTIHHSYWEQKSFMDLYETSEDFRSRTLIVSQKLFNSYHNQTECSDGQWTEGDFIVHFPGQIAKERERYIEHYLSRVLEHG